MTDTQPSETAAYYQRAHHEMTQEAARQRDRAEAAEAERDEMAATLAQAWGEGFEAGHTYLGEYAHGSNGPSDPPENPYERAGDQPATDEGADQ